MKAKNFLPVVIGLTILLCSACGSEKDSERKAVDTLKEKTTITVSADYPWFESLDALYEKADLVIRGKVIGSGSEWMSHLLSPSAETEDQQQITTIYTIEISEVYKGGSTDTETISLLQQGGTIGNVEYVCPDTAEIETEGEYIFFMTASALHNDSYWLLSPLQAIYRVEADGISPNPQNPLELTHEYLAQLKQPQ